MTAASMAEFRRVADDVRNWGRWGDDDELGTLNFITPDKVAQAAASVRSGKIFALGSDFGSGGPQGAFRFRANPTHVMTVDGGDAATLAEYGPSWLANPVAGDVASFFADNPFRFNDDMIVMNLQAASQWDAFSHVYYEDKLYNGFPADSVTSFGARHCGIDKVDVKGITSRGVLLDVVASPGYHGAISGLVKNALDYIEDLRSDPRVYLDNTPWGCITCAYGWQAAVGTLGQLRVIGHSLRAWPTPLGVAINSADPIWDESGALTDATVSNQLELLANQVLTFATSFAAARPDRGA